jgi:hypothetical protein
MLIKRHAKSYIVEMEDGSRWRIWPRDLATILKWTPSAQLVVVEIDDQFSAATPSLIKRMGRA